MLDLRCFEAFALKISFIAVVVRQRYIRCDYTIAAWELPLCNSLNCLLKQSYLFSCLDVKEALMYLAVRNKVSSSIYQEFEEKTS